MIKAKLRREFEGVSMTMADRELRDRLVNLHLNMEREMVQINLKKLIVKKQIALVIEKLIDGLDIPVAIRDIKGTILAGYGSKNVLYKFPIKAASSLIGWVTGSEKAVVVAQMLTYIATTELEKKKLAKDTLNKYEEINFLYDISGKIAACKGIREIADLAIAEARKILEATSASVMLLDPSGTVLEVVSAWGPEYSQKAKISRGEGIIGHVINSGQAEIVNDVSCDIRYVRGEKAIYSRICAPLTTPNRTIGAINLSNADPIEYTAEDLKLFSAIASQSAAAMENALLFEQLKDYSHTLEKKVAERTAALKLANEELHRYATLDGLTQVANRRRFDEYLMSSWQKLAEEKLPLSLILCDVDYFKLYNDTYGHQAGDDCLQQIALAIDRAVKNPNYLVARYGGEEFAVILPKTSAKGSLHIAETIKIEIEWLKIPHVRSKAGNYVTVSMGVCSIIPTANQLPEMLIAVTDEGLYEAKKLGRDRIILKLFNSSGDYI